MTTELMSCEEMQEYLGGREMSVKNVRALVREHLTEKLALREQELRGRRFGWLDESKPDHSGMTVEELDDYDVTL